MSIGYRLEQFAKQKFGSVTALNKNINELTGHKTSIYKYIKNERMPGATLLIPLAQLGCNINWLLTSEGEMLFQDIPKETAKELEYEIVKLNAQISILKEMVIEYNSKK